MGIEVLDGCGYVVMCVYDYFDRENFIEIFIVVIFEDVLIWILFFVFNG